MKKSRFTESQIVAVLKEGEAGVPVAELCRQHGISTATYYQWKSKYSGVQVSELQRLRELEAENARLKRMYADLALENAAIKDVLNRKSWVPRRFVWNLTARIHRSGARWGLWATRQSELSTNPPGGAFC